MTDQADKPLNVHQRILDVIRAVGYIRKDVAVNAGHAGTYRGVSHDAVVALLRKPMAEAGLTASISLANSTTTEGLTKSGSRRVIYQATYTCRIVNADDPADFVEGTIEAHADDGGDKAPGKALSYALKMFLLKAFMLETGDDEESRYEPDSGSFITAEQQAHLQDLIDATGTDKARFLAWLKADNLAAIPSGLYQSAEQALIRKLPKGGAQ